MGDQEADLLCEMRAKGAGTGFPGVTAMWMVGFPLGFLVTPVKLAEKLFALCRPPNPAKPSALLERMVRLDLAAQMEAQEEAEQWRAAATLRGQPSKREKGRS
ncbi:MAG: hypothetical protein JWO94_3203 [Verrucomicrobiaceae bacterium]|nr:hypothetical protein [Verrucomicrobiaceae bacterium]